MGDKHNDNIIRGPFGKRRRMAASKRPSSGDYFGQPKSRPGNTGWLSPEAYNALTRDEKAALTARRRQQSLQRPKRTRRGRRRSFGGYLRYQATVIVGTLGAVLAYAWLSESGPWLPNLRPTSPPVSANFGYCHAGGGLNCVVDGDTFWLNGANIRIADIDTPETHEYGCPEELSLGNRATHRLHELLESGPITLQPIDRDEDVYGRKLRRVYVNGRNVGETLIDEGLAHRYVRGKLPWC